MDSRNALMDRATPLWSPATPLWTVRRRYGLRDLVMESCNAVMELWKL